MSLLVFSVFLDQSLHKVSKSPIHRFPFDRRLASLVIRGDNTGRSNNSRHFKNVTSEFDLFECPVPQHTAILMDFLSDQVTAPLPQKDSFLFNALVNHISQILFKCLLRFDDLLLDVGPLLGKDFVSLNI